MYCVSRLKHPAVRRAIASVFLGVELLLFVVIADVFWVDQLVLVLATIF